MNIFILRHGVAFERDEWKGADDSRRPLTPEGEKQLKKIARALEKLEVEFDLILSSPFERAKKTAEIVASRLKLEKRLKFSEELESGGDREKLISEISRLKPSPENMLLVGHEPYLSELISRLVSGAEQIEIDLKKGGLCKLKANNLRFGHCAKLCWLLTPKQMELMA